jgi:hypothetical protein
VAECDAVADKLAHPHPVAAGRLDRLALAQGWFGTVLKLPRRAKQRTTGLVSKASPELQSVALQGTSALPAT